MKKVLAIVLTLSLCFASLAGCGSSPSDTPSAPAADPSAPQAGDAAEPVKLIMAIEVSSNTACAQASKSFAEMVKEKSGGSIEVDVFTDGTLGNENELWEAVQTGSVDIVWSGDGAVSANVPEWGFVALPYVFSSPEAATSSSTAATSRSSTRSLRRRATSWCSATVRARHATSSRTRRSRHWVTRPASPCACSSRTSSSPPGRRSACCPP